MIDFHSHILPYVDDGSKNYDMSIDMVKIAYDEETEYICATPHFIAGEYEITRNLYDERLDNLQKLCKMKGIETGIVTGMEIYIHPDLPKLYKEKKIWGINDSSYLLIELPMDQFPLYTEDVFYELRLQGAVPILAHPERNFKIMRDKGLLLNLLDQGTLAQVNSGSLVGLYGKEIKQFAEYLVKSNMVHVIGSDAHNSEKRSPRIQSALNIIKNINGELFDWIESNQKSIMEGREVEVLQVKEEKKKFGIFNFFK